jgi:predicted aspartyl protease
MKYVLGGAFALAAASTVYAQPQMPTVDAVLAANRAAVGDVLSTGGAEFSYAWSGSGLTGTRTDIVDLATGAFVEAKQAGIVGEAQGFDGKIPWMRDVSGANTTQEGGDRIAVAVNEAYRVANLWWRPGHAGATVACVGREVTDGQAVDHLVLTPKSGKSFDAWFDANTHLLARIAEDRQFFHTQTLFADYRRQGGLMLPHVVTLDNGSGEADREILRLTHVSFGPERPLSAYSRPTAPPVGASIDGGGVSVTLPFRLLNNHIYVDARVNGKGPYTFIVDTGGHTLVSPRLVSELGLKTIGAAAMSGAGEKTEVSGFAQVAELALGAVRMRNQVAFATQIYDPAIEGIPVDGMVGFELFRRFAVQIDYGRNTLTITDPTRFEVKDAGTAIPFVFYDHLPMVQGFIADLPARFDIDTGSRSDVDVTRPFVTAHALRARFPKGVSAVTGWGVGGPSRGYVVHLPSLTLGTIKVDDLAAGLSEAKSGSISDSNYDGNVGGGLLKRFVATFDYAHQRMYLKPIVPGPTDAGSFDRSGMWINAAPDGYAVTDVARGGPAAQAGIEVGDIITTLDGAAFRSEGLSDTRILLRSRPAGTKIPIELRRGADTKRVTLVLSDQIVAFQK